jgi:hypothetical protein
MPRQMAERNGAGAAHTTPNHLGSWLIAAFLPTLWVVSSLPGSEGCHCLVEPFLALLLILGFLLSGVTVGPWLARSTSFLGI